MIFGHSICKKFRKYLRRREVEYTTSLKLSNLTTVTIEGFSGLTIDGAIGKATDSSFVRNKPEVIFLQLGGKDFRERRPRRAAQAPSNAPPPPDVVATKLLMLAGIFRRRHDDSKVIIGNLLPRFVSARYGISANEARCYRRWAAEVNTELLVHSRDIEFVSVWAHNDIFTNRSEHLFSDGIHSYDQGQKKFYKSARGDLISTIKSL